MPRDNKKIAHDVVAEIAPDELDLFEQIWAEHEKNPALLGATSGKSEKQLGAGLDFATPSLLTLLLIPIIAGVTKDIVSKGLTEIIRFVRQQLSRKPEPRSEQPQLSDEEIDRIARVIAKRFVVGQDLK